jgi:hypothetical protein
MSAARTVGRPIVVYALTALWALKAFQDLLSGVVGGAFYIAKQTAEGTLFGYGLQLAYQSLFLSALLAGASFYVMTALWLGRRGARRWGVAVAAAGEACALALLFSRPVQFGSDQELVRVVLVSTVVNLGIITIFLFDRRLAAFLGSTRLVGWWAPSRHPEKRDPDA